MSLISFLIPTLTNGIIGIILIVVGLLILYQGIKLNFIIPNSKIDDAVRMIGILFIVVGVGVAFLLSWVQKVLASTELTVIGVMVAVTIILITLSLSGGKRGKKR